MFFLKNNVFKKEGTVLLAMGEAAFVSRESGKLVLATLGLTTCVGVLLFDGSKAFLAHMDAKTDLNSLLSNLKKFHPNSSKAHVFGGYGDETDLLARVLMLLKTNEFPFVHHTDGALVSGFRMDSLAFNVKTGHLVCPLPAAALEGSLKRDLFAKNCSDERFNISGTEFPLKITYTPPAPVKKKQGRKEHKKMFSGMASGFLKKKTGNGAAL